MSSKYTSGILMQLGLITSFGPQNILVLTSAISSRNPWIVSAICIVCDSILISIATTSSSLVIEQNSFVLELLRVSGGLTLVWHAINTFSNSANIRYSDFTKTSDFSASESFKVTSIYKSALLTLGVTLLNPHVYLDAFLFLGATSAQFDQSGRSEFAAGAITASFGWFIGLTIGGTLLAQRAKNIRAWSCFQKVTGIILLVNAGNLLFF